MTELRVAGLRAADHAPHALHACSRPWPETNCYLDLWIELLHTLGRDPMPLMGLAAALDWEADHFTFLKPSASDIFATTGVAMHELALWRDTEAHVAAQLGAGAVPLLEVDAFFLPDTAGNAYRERHIKTTIAVIAMDPAAPWLEYVHNAGLFRLEGDDVAGVLGRGERRPALLPFAELARVAAPAPAPDIARRYARELLARYVRMRGPGDPIVRFGAAIPVLLAEIGGDPLAIHALCFNTTRQIGAAFGLLADHLGWLGEDGADAAWLADAAKALQFRLSRAARRGRVDPELPATLEQMSAAWQRCMQAVHRASRLPDAEER